MTKLIVIKNRVIALAEEYDLILRLAGKYLVGLIMLLTINRSLGFYSIDRVNPEILCVFLALVCCLLPADILLFVGAALVLLNLYALALEAAIAGAAIFAVFVFLYLRFSAKGANVLILSALSGKLGIPYVMPLGCGLLCSAATAIPVAGGTVIYYFLKGINENAAVISEQVAGEDASMGEIFRMVLSGIVGNREFYLVAGLQFAALLVVYVIRRLKVDQAWTLAIIVGCLIQLVGYPIGCIIMKLSVDIPAIFLGNLAAFVIAWGIKAVYMDLDYTRVERVQFEDDDYYYYVKAVPKKALSEEEIQVKTFSTPAPSAKETGRQARPEERDFLKMG